MTKAPEEIGQCSLTSAPTLPYQKPTLAVVGNLRDLLAGTGTKLSDNQIACSVADSDTLVC